jgi:hypothetical protein
MASPMKTIAEPTASDTAVGRAKYRKTAANAKPKGTRIR